MKRCLRCVCLLMLGLIVAAFNTHAQVQVYYEDRHNEGWYWYQAEMLRREAVTQQLSQYARQHPVAMMNALHKTLAQHLDRTILDPTPEHVLAYMRLQRWVSEQSQRFAHQWQAIRLHQALKKHA